MDVFGGDDEVDYEYKLAVLRSKRIEDDIRQLADLDLDLNWGRSKKSLEKTAGGSRE